MRISIILPSLNVKKYIKESIDTVCSQTMNDIEIICVDADSTDGTKEIIEMYQKQDNRINLIISSRKSYGYQVNLGLKKATGEYVAIVDTDDFIDSEMYEKLFYLAEKEQADFVKGGYKSFFEYGGRRYETVTKNGNLHNHEEIVISVDSEKDNYELLQNIGPIWGGIYNREFLLENDIWLNETPGASFQDTSFNMIVALCAKKMVFVEDCFYHYRTDRAEASVKSNNKLTCVIDEYQYITDYMNIHQVRDNKQIAYVARNKIHTYFWNLDRLDSTGQQTFIEMIADEMKEYASGGKHDNLLNDKELTKHKLLTDWEACKAYRESKLKNERAFCEIISGVKNEEKYVIVGAGMYLWKLLFVKNILGNNYVLDVCDNSKEKQGTFIEDYQIISVEDAVQKNTNEKWIVANKYYADDIEKQLVELGINVEQITKLSYIPEPFEMTI